MVVFVASNPVNQVTDPALVQVTALPAILAGPALKKQAEHSAIERLHSLRADMLRKN